MMSQTSTAPNVSDLCHVGWHSIYVCKQSHSLGILEGNDFSGSNECGRVRSLDYNPALMCELTQMSVYVSEKCWEEKQSHCHTNEQPKFLVMLWNAQRLTKNYINSNLKRYIQSIRILISGVSPVSFLYFAYVICVAGKMSAIHSDVIFDCLLCAKDMLKPSLNIHWDSW